MDDIKHLPRVIHRRGNRPIMTAGEALAAFERWSEMARRTVAAKEER